MRRVIASQNAKNCTINKPIPDEKFLESEPIVEDNMLVKIKIKQFSCGSDVSRLILVKLLKRSYVQEN